MGDDSSRSIVKTLKNEWSLFWEVFQGEEEKEPTLTSLSKEEVKAATKSLLNDRKKINQKFESLSKEIDLNTAKLESLKLVGADEEATLRRINELNDLGQNMSDAMTRIDRKLREMREHEERLLAELVSL